MTPESLLAWYSSLPQWLIILAAIWSLIWKGLALWKAGAIKKNPLWFIVLLVLNTFGLLEILYLFIFSEMGKKKARK
jgi:hypothetical protein